MIRIKRPNVYGVLILMSFCAILIASYGRTEAAAPNCISRPGGNNPCVRLNPNPGPTDIPQANKAMLTDDCTDLVKNPPNSSGQSHTPCYTPWISPTGAGQNATTTVRVTYGTTSLSLRYHYSGVVGFPYSNVGESRQRVYDWDGVHPGSKNPAISGIPANNFMSQYFSSSTTPGTYSTSSQDFTFTPPSGFTHNGVYNIKLYYSSINHFVNPDAYGCVTNNGRSGNLGGWDYDDPARCPRASTEIPINVIIDPPPLTVSGTVYTMNRDGTNIVRKSGVTYDTCNDVGEQTKSSTGANGLINFTVIDGSGYCLRLTSPTPPGYDGPFVRPWNMKSGYDGYPSSSPGICGSFSSLSPPVTYCPNPSYEYQVAGRTSVPINPPPQPPWRPGDPRPWPTNYDRGSEGGFDFFYVAVPDPSCTISTNPFMPEPGEPTSLTVKVTNNAKTANMSFTKPYGAIFDNAGLPVSFTMPSTTIAPGGTWTSGSIPINATTMGEYKPKLHITGPGVDTECQGSIKIANKPYLKINNGDIAAGISNTCTGWGGPGDGTIKAWNQAQSGGLPNNGAGTNLAAYALNVIDGFTSAQSPSGSSPPIGLTFASNTNPPFGGSFGSDIACPTDYWQSKDDAHTKAGPIVPTPPADGKTILYMDGNVRITNDIILNPDAPSAAAYDLHSFKLIVNGNIYIDPGVKRLDGLYVAQGHNIYTCSNGFAAPSILQLNSSAAGGCKQYSLTVNGAFVAKEVKLYRSIGTLKDAPNPNSVAEQFNYTPNVWLAPANSSGQPTFSTKYDAITSMPPVL